ncbi:MAG: tetratricopeptide repeat protein [Candidatus Kryptoniota bacterium]
MIEEKKFRRALPFARELTAKYPDTTIVHVGLALCLSETGKLQESLNILQDADRKFPNDSTILYHIAETQRELKEFEKAEETYRRSLELTPETYHTERSECYNGPGVVLWEQHKREDAPKMWKLAVRENPGNEIAQKNLEKMINEFREPVAVSKSMDDVFHFMNIQQELYLKERGIKEFGSKKELDGFLSAVKEAWNTYLSPRSKEMETMTAAEKTELFRSVKPNFSRISKFQK